MKYHSRRSWSWPPKTRARTAAIAVAAAAVTAVAVAGSAPTAAARHLAEPPPPGASSVIQRLSDTQLAGQRVIYSYPGLTPPPALLRAIRRGQAAGVIFFAGNISSPAQLAAVSRQLQRADASRRNPLRAPLLLMTDQEGGVVRRLPGAPALSEKQIGQAADPAGQARLAGAGAAANLHGTGLNVNLAPVLDVYAAAGNFIDQYGRSYSRHPGQVATLGADFIRAQQGGGVAAAAKHFPGLGAAARNQDTDLRPVKLPVPAATLRRVDERPYRTAIAARVKLVVVSWAVYPALDPRRPAGLSPLVVQGELRQRLGFQGVTITDALEAGALRRYGTIGRRGQLAARAGMDLLLCAGHSVGEGQRAVAGLARAYRDGLVSRGSGETAVARIASLRAGLRG
ncbi:MAG: glycoside hydrolase family 3 N-terminal domain-containing protein [Streptosporangiaceae bacterium]